MLTAWLISAALAAPCAAELVSEPAFFSALDGLHESVQTATHSGAHAAQIQDDEATLLRRLDDRDSRVRLEALRGLKWFVGNSTGARARVLLVLNSSSESLSVRYQAAKTLSAAAGDSAVSDALLALGQGGGDSRLRAIAYKSLCWEAPVLEAVSGKLVDAALNGSDADVRRGAIWGLYNATGISETRLPLLKIALEDQDVGVRIEALKSLFGAVDYEEVRAAAVRLAGQRDAAAPVRYTAIMMLAQWHTEDDRAFLKRIAEHDDDPWARRAALVALEGPGSDGIVAYFHLARHDLFGTITWDPIDFE